MTKILDSLVYNFNVEMTYYNNKKYKPCVVFDIDGTILIDGIYSPKNNSELINEVYEFLLYLQRKNISIFIITARPDNSINRYGTSKMLKELGINYKYLYMWDQNMFNNHSNYKENARKEIFENNYNIIMSLGDNYWDYGEYGGLGVHIYNDGEEIELIKDFL
jgi:predicted secreted acid phosphatase